MVLVKDVVQFSSLQEVSTCFGKPMCTASHFSEVSPALCVKHFSVCVMDSGMLQLVLGCITSMFYSFRYSTDFRSTPTCVHGIWWTQQCRFLSYQCIRQTWVAVCVDLFANLFLNCLHEKIQMMFVKWRITLKAGVFGVFFFFFFFKFYWKMRATVMLHKIPYFLLTKWPLGVDKLCGIIFYSCNLEAWFTFTGG